jgi:sulfide:quinone oxidoreductase
MLESKGIGFHPLHKLVSVDASARELHFQGKEPIGYDLLVAIAPHRAPQVARTSGLLNEAGWIPVDRRTLRTKHEGVYAIGDIAAVSIPGRWKAEVPLMLPKAGVFAHTEAEVVAHRIADEINGKTPSSELGGIGYCALEAGAGRAGFAFGEFFAEPSPRLTMRETGRVWHWGKVLFEQWWLSPFGVKREFLRILLELGSKTLRIPAERI